MLYLIMTTIVEAWAFWGRNEIAPNRQAPEDGEQLSPPKKLHSIVSIRDAFQYVLRTHGDAEARR
jgi:hypothetical protein